MDRIKRLRVISLTLSNSYRESITHASFCIKLTMFVTGFEKSRLPCTHQQDTLFTIKWLLYTHLLTIQAGIRVERLPRLVSLWLVSEACQTSTSPWMVFKWLYIYPLDEQTVGYISPQDWLMSWANGFSCFMWYVVVKMVAMDANWLF